VLRPALGPAVPHLPLPQRRADRDRVHGDHRRDGVRRALVLHLKRAAIWSVEHPVVHVALVLY
jgi:hypothetical protein